MQDDRPLVGCRVLVVEDEYFIARELSAILQDKGARVVGPFGNADQALDQIARDGFDVAVLDINLQGADGYACTDALRRHRVPLVVASAYDEARIPLRFSDVHLWQKPYSEPALVEDLRRLCGGLRAGRQPLAATASTGPPP